MTFFFYGALNKNNVPVYKDITQHVIEKCVNDGHVIIPINDVYRPKLFGDPLVGIVKHIIIKHYELEYIYGANDHIDIPILKINDTNDQIELDIDQNNIHIFNNALITNFIRNPTKGTSNGAVYDELGNLCKLSQRNSADGYPNDNNSQIDVSAIPINDGIAIYLGHMSTHYGHFLLETLSRCWFMCENPNIRYDYVIFNKWIEKDMHAPYESFISIISQALAIPEKKIILLERQIRFTKVYVPEQTYCFLKPALPILPKQRTVFNQMVNYSLKKYNSDQNGIAYPEKIYIMRPTNCRRVKNHKKLESIFKENGFYIMDSTVNSFFADCLMYHNAKVIATIEGTSAHNSVFMKDNQHLIILGSPRHPNDSRGYSVQQYINPLNSVNMHSINMIGINGDVNAGNDPEYVRNRLGEILNEIYPDK